MSTEFGFYFYPATDTRSHGHPKFAFNLYTQPTGEHFDPEHAVLPGTRPKGGIEHISLSHPWRGGNSNLHICIGRILLTDRLHKKVEAFSFGGTLAISPHEDHTACVLTSTAPIFDLVRPGDTLTNVTSGIEVAIAEQRAHWKDDYAFEETLATTEPAELYLATLLAHQASLAAIPELAHTPAIRTEVKMVHEMIAAAKEASSIDNPPSLAELLAAP